MTIPFSQTRDCSHTEMSVVTQHRLTHRPQPHAQEHTLHTVELRRRARPVGVAPWMTCVSDLMCHRLLRDCKVHTSYRLTLRALSYYGQTASRGLHPTADRRLRSRRRERASGAPSCTRVSASFEHAQRSVAHHERMNITTSVHLHRTPHSVRAHEPRRRCVELRRAAARPAS